jgi:hypothetical protein
MAPDRLRDDFLFFKEAGGALSSMLLELALTPKLVIHSIKDFRRGLRPLDEGEAVIWLVEVSDMEEESAIDAGSGSFIAL